MPIVTVILTVLLTAATLALLTPIVVVSLECLIAALSRNVRPISQQAASRGPVAVLIPAHNEEAGLSATLASMRTQLTQNDRVVVVADNCTDRTAEIAQEHGAAVVERTNLEHRGKGYALDAGIAALAADPPDIVVIVDADCLLRAGVIAALADQVRHTARPAQAVYLMSPPPSATTGQRLSAFAFLIKNQVRPLGLWQVGLPCLLTGTGMAFPWSQIRNVPLASGNIVEDMQLGLDLTVAGSPPLLCPQAVVTSVLPAQRQAAARQRRRWEHGHLRAIRQQVPRLISHFLRAPSLSSLAIALELAVPPLSMLIGLWSVLMVATLALADFADRWLPLACCATGGVLMTISLLGAWIRFGRHMVPARSLAGVPLYVFRKAGLYWSALRAPEREWVRTERPTDAARASLDSPRYPEKVQIGHACIDNVTMSGAIMAIEMLIRRRKPAIVVTPNVDHVVRLDRDPVFRSIYENAQLVLADGMPLLWAARLLKTPLREVSGSDLFPQFCRVAGEKGYRLFFLGGRPGAAEAAAAKFRRLFPRLEIATDCPPFGFEHDPEENGRVIRKVREFRPDVLFVGLGAPKQELWMHRHSDECQVPVSAGVGGSFEFESGLIRRAPRALQRIGLEWFWRLLAEPRRMYRRYLIEDPRFLGILWRQLRVREARLPAEPVVTPD
jgi:exopolysaccharide biosynthesis WecB/TagA/CpsF family protein